MVGGLLMQYALGEEVRENKRNLYIDICNTPQKIYRAYVVKIG